MGIVIHIVYICLNIFFLKTVIDFKKSYKTYNCRQYDFYAKHLTTFFNSVVRKIIIWINMFEHKQYYFIYLFDLISQKNAGPYLETRGEAQGY